jgi:phosphoribosylanthranilate isomerase
MSGKLWIKVCGLRTIEAIDAAVAAGADAVGFVFHEASPRHLTLDEARALVAGVPAGVETVAVFLHPSRTLVAAVIDAIRPDWIQVDAADVDGLQLPVGQKTLPVFRTSDRDAADAVASNVRGRRFLLESAQSGAGERADWTAAATLAAAGELVLAGGLDAGNVGAAIETVRPFGVDVSSGVESSRGVKDAALIRDFVVAARK